jgi:membrane protease YdiL (CAAX protease family)
MKHKPTIVRENMSLITSENPPQEELRELYTFRNIMVAVLGLPLMLVLGTAISIPLYLSGVKGITPAVLVNIVAEILIIILALALVGKNRKWRETLYLKNFRFKNVVMGFFVGLALFVLLQAVSIGVSAAGGDLESSKTSTSLAAIDGFTKYIVLLILVPLVVPLIEELFFRGFIFGFIKNSGLPNQKIALTAGILISSVTFGIAHFQGFDSISSMFVMLLTATIGAVNCWLVYKTDSIYTAYACHAGYNLATSGVMLLAMSAT